MFVIIARPSKKSNTFYRQFLQSLDIKSCAFFRTAFYIFPWNFLLLTY